MRRHNNACHIATLPPSSPFLALTVLVRIDSKESCVFCFIYDALTLEHTDQKVIHILVLLYTRLTSPYGAIVYLRVSTCAVRKFIDEKENKRIPHIDEVRAKEGKS